MSSGTVGNRNKAIELEKIPCASCGGSDTVHLITTRIWHKGRALGSPCRVVLCRACGLGYLNPRMTAPEYRKFYTDEYWQLNSSNLIGASTRHRYLAQQIYDFINEYITDVLGTDLSILDIGCGTGETLHILADRTGSRGWGVESSASAAKWAREKHGHTIIQRDFFDSRLPKSHFDLIVASAVLEHFLDPLAALYEMKRLLKPQGLLFIRVPNLEGLSFRYRSAKRVFKVVHTYYFTPMTLSTMLQRAGFQQVANSVKPPIRGKAQGEIWALYHIGEGCGEFGRAHYRKTITAVRWARIRDLGPRLILQSPQTLRNHTTVLLKRVLPENAVELLLKLKNKIRRTSHVE